MKRILIWALVLLMSISIVASFSLIGCKEETASVEEEAAEEEAAPVEEEAAEEEIVEEEAVEEEVELGVKPPEEKVKINVFNWAWFDDPEQIETLLAKFYEKYPTIEVEVTRPAIADQDTLLTTGLLAGEGPDVWGNNAGGGAAGLVKYIDYTLPLDSLAAQEWGANWKDNIAEAALSTVYWGTGGTDQTMALPEYVQTYGSAGYYNKTMFDDLGIEPPTTWDELLAVAGVLKENGITPIAHSGAEGWTNQQFWFSLAADFAGDKLFQAINGEGSFTDPDLIAATEKYLEFFDEELFGGDPFTGVMYFDYINGFYEEKFGLDFMGNWEFRVAVGNDLWGEQDPNTVFRTWEYPDWNEDGKVPGTLLYPAILWSINKDISEEKQRASFIFIKEMVSGLFAEVRASGPNWMAFSGVEPDFDVLGLDQEGIDEYKYWADALQSASGVGLTKYTELEEALINNLNEVAVGLKTPTEAMEAVQAVSETLERPY